MEPDRTPPGLPHLDELARPAADSHEVIVDTIGNTTTRTGLVVQAALDTGDYPAGIKVTGEQLRAVPLRARNFHGEWNYTITPPPITTQTTTM